MDFEESGRPNKSALKRAAKDIETLAEQLSGEGPEALKRLELSGDLRAELDLVRRAKGHGARKRQIKHLAGYLRNHADECAAIQAHLQGESERHYAEQRTFHRVEQWRDRLCDPKQVEAALQELRECCPQLDFDALAKLARTAGNGDKGAARKIFRALREVAEQLG